MGTSCCAYHLKNVNGIFQNQLFKSAKASFGIHTSQTVIKGPECILLFKQISSHDHQGWLQSSDTKAGDWALLYPYFTQLKNIFLFMHEIVGK